MTSIEFAQVVADLAQKHLPDHEVVLLICTPDPDNSLSAIRNVSLERAKFIAMGFVNREDDDTSMSVYNTSTEN